MIVNINKLKEAIEQTLREINDACLQMRSEGVVCLLPEEVTFTANLVTNGDINVVERSQVETEADGEVVTLRQQLTPDVDDSTQEGESHRTERTTAGNGVETTRISHPQVTTAGSGADNSTEQVIYTHEPA